jgi:SAM-dependent methyltransferase
MKKKIKLNLGCGVHLVKNFINVDKYVDLDGLKSKKGVYAQAVIDKGSKFVKADMSALPFKDNYADYIESFDAIEHVGFFNIEKVLHEMYRVLKPGGKLCLMTTNFDQIAEYWATNIKGNKFNLKVYKDWMEVIYGNQAHEGEFHNIPFNPDFLGRLLFHAGFKVDKIKMVIYPMYSPQHPPSQTAKHPKDTVQRSEMIWVEAIK